MIKAFPKIFTLGQRYTENIFKDKVFVEEKCDGSQFSFAKINGELICRSKGKQQEIACPDKLFSVGIEYLKSVFDKIPEGIQIYAEYLRKPKHNTLCYKTIPKNHFMCFGAYNINDDKFIHNRLDLKELTDILDIDLVPTIFEGKIETVDEIKTFLQTESYLGGCKVEGVVIKNYNREVLIADQIIPVLCGKYVSDEFKELHVKNWKKENTGRGRWDQYKERFCTEARWLKAFYYLRDNNELDYSLKDIGKLLKRVNIDITEEEKENIKDYLWKEFGEEVLRSATKGLPEWYKTKMIVNCFKEEILDDI